MTGTIILPCTCEHEEQDKLYGKGNRVHNIGQNKGKSTGKASCTVCCPNNRLNRMQPIDDLPPNSIMKSSYTPKKRIRVLKTVPTNI